MNTEERLTKLKRELIAKKRRNRWLLAVVGLGVVGVLAWTLTTITSPARPGPGGEQRTESYPGYSLHS